MRPVSVAGNFRQRRKRGRQDIGWNGYQRQDIEMLAPCQTCRKCRPGVLIGVPVRQTGVMTSNEISEDLSCLAQLLDGMNGAGAGVIHPAEAFDMCFFGVVSGLSLIHI